MSLPRWLTGWSCVALGLLVFASDAIAQDKRPNVLLIMADDLKQHAGVLWRSACQDSAYRSPGCARCDVSACLLLLSALWTEPQFDVNRLVPQQHWHLGNAQIFRQTIPKQQSMPQAFRNAGYFCGPHRQDVPLQRPQFDWTNGHDDPGSWEMELNPAGVDRLQEEKEIFSLTPVSSVARSAGMLHPKMILITPTVLMAEDAQWVLERCAKRQDRPFFLADGFFRPHTPYVSPKKWFDLYPADKMPVVSGIKEDQVDIPAPV